MSLKFVGDLSIADACVLAYWSEHQSILEFGCGGSTQIFADSASRITSVDTSQYWIDRTKKNIALLDDPKPVEFILFDDFKYEGEYDAIFVDGEPSKRLEFAQKAWPLLKPNGAMIFHDTRRPEYFKDVSWIAQQYFNEIDQISVNYNYSNMTLIYKSEEPLHYENWNETEGKPLWAYGNGEIPEGEGLWVTEI